MVTVGRIIPLVAPYANKYRQRVMMDGRRSPHFYYGRRLSLIAIAATTVAGGYALSILPSSHNSLSSLQLRAYHKNNNNEELPSYSRLLDVLPSDLDALGNKDIMGAVGVQILLFAGWTKVLYERIRNECF